MNAFDLATLNLVEGVLKLEAHSILCRKLYAREVAHIPQIAKLEPQTVS